MFHRNVYSAKNLVNSVSWKIIIFAAYLCKMNSSGWCMLTIGRKSEIQFCYFSYWLYFTLWGSLSVGGRGVGCDIKTEG